MNLTAICVTTSCHHRLVKMIQTIGQLDALPDGYFQRKILSVDDIGEGIPEWLKNDIRDAGWEIIWSKYGNITRNIGTALDKVNTDWVYYTEDDVWHWDEVLPKSFLEDLVTRTYGGKRLGLVGFLEGAYDYESDAAIEYLKDRQNYESVPGCKEACIYHSDPNILKDHNGKGDNTWIQFPVSILRTDVFRRIFSHAMSYYKKVQIERALTMSWNSLKMNREFVKLGFIRRPEFEKIQPGLDYASERGDRNLMFHNYRQFKVGIPGSFHFI